MNDTKHVAKSIGAGICCILCITVIVLFIYGVSKTQLSSASESYQISDNAILNGFYQCLVNGVVFDRFFYIFGLAALLCEILFSKPLVFLFSQLPLGHVYDSDAAKPMTIKTRLVPAFLIGIASVINIFYSEFKPESFAQNAKVLNWILFAVIGLSFVAQLVILLSQGGIWRCLVSGGLLIAANVSIGTLFGMLAAFLCVAFVGLVFALGFILLGIVAFCILSKTMG
ncbi:MAG: hypothetical protein IK134_05420 [Oscillospiraceae bacterium]|nr:hypothetical protein [Oscillospiraceae bacterium]